MEKIQAARRFFLGQSFGVLSTISIDVPGYPFGSVTPYCADERCRPIIYISTIAQHTKNILVDSRVSLTVVPASGDSDDVLTQGRVNCIADARAFGPDEQRPRERYFRYFPQSRHFEVQAGVFTTQ